MSRKEPTEAAKYRKRIVEVEWEDCAASHGWQAVSDMPGAWMAVSVGYVVKDDDEGITIVESLCLEGGSENKPKDMGCAMTVPRSQVRRVRNITPKRGKQRG